MSLKLNGATSGSIELDVPAAIGSDLSMTIPATAGTILAADPTKLSVDSSGLLLHPARPSFLARGVTGAADQPTTGDQSVLSTLLTNVSSGGKGVHNIGNHYNTSNGQFTCPVDGLYLCTGNVRWETGDFTQNEYIRLYMHFTGPTHTENNFSIAALTGRNEAFTSFLDQNISGVAYLNAGDVVTLNGGMSGGTAKLFTVESSFSVTFLG